MSPGKYNTNKAQKRSAGSIVLFLWLLQIAWVARVTVFIRQRASSEFSSVDILAGIQIAIVFLVAMTIFMSLKWQFVHSKIRGTSLLLILIYYIICAMSSAWSASPAYSFYRAFEFLILFSGVLVAVSGYNRFEDIEKVVLVVSTIVIVLSMYVNFKFSHNIFSLWAWHTNSYSASAAMVFCYCLGEYFQSEKKRKKRLFRFGVLSFGALALGTSAASNVSAFCGILLILFFNRKLGLLCFGILMLSIYFMLVYILDTDFSFIQGVFFPGKDEKDIMTMTGRTRMWEVFWEYILRSPIFGHGFAVLTSGRGNVFANDPHNSIFSILLGTGSIGFTVFLFFVLKFISESIQTAFRRVQGAIGCATAIVVGLINSLAMPMIFAEWEESSLVFTCLISFFIIHVIAPYRLKLIRKRF